MNEANEAGFDGTVKINKSGVTIRFRIGDSFEQLKEYVDSQPCNEFYWCKLEKMFLYRNSEGKFFEMKFEEIEL